MIIYKIGNAVLPNIKTPYIICHIVNDQNGFGKGFVEELKQHYPLAKTAYHAWAANFNRDKSKVINTGKFELGKTQFIKINNDIYIANMLAQKGYKSNINLVPVQYDHLEKCLSTVARFARIYNLTIVMPRIGCGLGGGLWDNIELIINKTCNDLNVEVYYLS